MRRIAFILVTLFVLVPAAIAQTGVRAVVSNEAINIRVAPALGADVIASVTAGYVFESITARSADNEWLRVLFNGEEGWVNLAPLTILDGDIAALPVADPRTIPYGGFESPRAGSSSATSLYQVRATNGVRVRAGPSQAYPTIANLNANTVVFATGRTISNTWIQVVYQGTLGWVSLQFIELLGFQLAELPVDGITADAPPPGDNFNDYVDTLKLLLARLDLAQPSLDTIRAYWTDAAINGRASCQPYPARPSDINIPVPLLAAFFDPLDTLQRDFNDLMFNIREAIDLFIAACDQPGTLNPVSEATVIGALGIVNLADRQIAALREKLIALIPPPLEADPDECIFTYQNRSQLLKIINNQQIYGARFPPNQQAIGFCFDAVAGESFYFEAIQLRGNFNLLVVVTPFDNPTNFVAVGTTTGDPTTQGGFLVTVTATLPVTGRYLLLFRNLGTDPLPPDNLLAFGLIRYTGPVSFISGLFYDQERDVLLYRNETGQQFEIPVSQIIPLPDPATD